MRFPEADGYTVRIGLLADAEDLGPRVLGAEWGQTKIPITLDATIAGYLPRRLADARIRLIVEVEDVPVRQFTGHKTAIVPGENAFTTDLLSSSAGSLGQGKDAIKLRKFTEYPGESPLSIVWDYVKALPYERSNVSIEAVPRVSLNYSGSGEFPGFMAHEPVGALLERMGSDASVGYDYRDTAYDGFKAWLPAPISAASLDSDFEGSENTYASEYLPDWSRQRPSSPLLRYAAVRVYRQGPDGRDLSEAIAEIPYPADQRRPDPRRTLDIPVEDNSDDADGNMRDLARRLALEIVRSPYEGRLLLPAYNALIERDDRFRVEENHRDSDGTFHLLWAMKTENYSHQYAESEGASNVTTGALSTSLGYTAALIAEDRIAVPTFLGPQRVTSPKPQIVQTERRPYGVIKDDIYFEDSLTWVAAQGDDLIFYDNAPAGTITITGDDIVVSE